MEKSDRNKPGKSNSRRRQLRKIQLGLSMIAVLLCVLIGISVIALCTRPSKPVCLPEETWHQQESPAAPTGPAPVNYASDRLPEISPEGATTPTGEPQEHTEEENTPTAEANATIPAEDAATIALTFPAVPPEENGEEPITTEFHEEMTTELSKPAEEPAQSELAVSWAMPMLIISLVLLAADAVGMIACGKKIMEMGTGMSAPVLREKAEPIARTASSGPNAEQAIKLGQLQNIGARPYQEDSSGVINLVNGVFAVVADGMGGLSDGDKVSQTIVYSMLEMASALGPNQMDGVLEKMLASANDAVNRMMSENGIRQGGSTLMAVLVRDNRFHWISVGDSHIYLYRAGELVQLNQEHNRGQELLRRAIGGQLSFDEVRADPKKSGLTSYLGMGSLKYVEKSLRSIALECGDRILLTTDGVFNALSDQEICNILKGTPDVVKAARLMESGVIKKAFAHQDNFTAVIFGF